MQHFVLDCERMKYQNTGLYHYCLNLGRHLQQYINQQEESLTFFFPKQADKIFGLDAQYLPQSSWQKFYMPSLHSYTLWHATFQDTHYMPMRNKWLKVVLTVHDLNFIYEKAKEHKRKRYLQRLQQNIDRSDALVCISKHSLKDLQEHCRIAHKEVRVIYNGANALLTPLLAGHSYRPSKPFLFCLGVINRKKNYHSLLPMLALKEDLELVIAGRMDDEDYATKLYSEAQQLGIAHRVKLITNITEEEKSWYMHHCLAFMMPSIAEGFGLPVIEAMSIGKPVFLSSATALPEIGGAFGFYFQSFEPQSMLATFEQGMQRYSGQQMASSIVEYSKTFSWHQAAKEYLALYRALLS